jgi:hypothetical protein
MAKQIVLGEITTPSGQCTVTILGPGFSRDDPSTFFVDISPLKDALGVSATQAKEKYYDLLKARDYVDCSRGLDLICFFLLLPSYGSSCVLLCVLCRHRTFVKKCMIDPRSRTATRTTIMVQPLEERKERSERPSKIDTAGLYVPLRASSVDLLSCMYTQRCVLQNWRVSTLDTRMPAKKSAQLLKKRCRTLIRLWGHRTIN